MLIQEIRQSKIEVKFNGDEYKFYQDSDVLVISDIHIDVKKNRPNYFWEIMGYFDSIIKKVETLTNPIVIFLGDIFNKDLNLSKGLMYFEEAKKRFDMLDNLTNGRVFMVLGNHESTYSDTTPTALLMDLSPFLRSVLESNVGKIPNRSYGKILKTPHTIRIWDTKFSLAHFNKYNKDYTHITTNDCNFHILLMHDTFINNTMRKCLENKVPVDLIWKHHLNDLDLKNFDVTIFGDFHIPLPLFRINNRRNTLVIVGGTLGRNNIATEIHSSVKIPIIKVRKNSPTRVIVENFPLIPYEQSYNIGKNAINRSRLNNEVKKIIKDMKGDIQDINIENFFKYLFKVYDKEWAYKIYHYYNTVKGVNNFGGNQRYSE